MVSTVARAIMTESEPSLRLLVLMYGGPLSKKEKGKRKKEKGKHSAYLVVLFFVLTKIDPIIRISSSASSRSSAILDSGKTLAATNSRSQ
jgi:hypothetical protein